VWRSRQCHSGRRLDEARDFLPYRLAADFARRRKRGQYHGQANPFIIVTRQEPDRSGCAAFVQLCPMGGQRRQKLDVIPARDASRAWASTAFDLFVQTAKTARIA